MVTYHYDFGIRALVMVGVVIDDFGTEWDLLPDGVPRSMLNVMPLLAAVAFLDSGEAH
ncbi:hypothetical protein [Burkholderia plantarii]|uniref:hypothetical protein n=1 Tax=Burkholderia plantarii TaxID=41899 RepID=UPI0014956402|nr:hypothetical protein [Burkholderia plantarii]